MQALVCDEETMAWWVMTPPEVTRPGPQCPGVLTPETGHFPAAFHGTRPLGRDSSPTSQLAKDRGLVNVIGQLGQGWEGCSEEEMRVSRLSCTLFANSHLSPEAQRPSGSPLI